MSATNLLNLNVDTLFEQHSVPEIDIVQKKIQSQTEHKREELRTTVGERYRDLLKAADTISAMQDSSSTLIEQVDCISMDLCTLNEQQLLGFKTNDSTDLLLNRSANKQLNNYFSTMVQIKLLTSLPELIWSHIDNERFYAATELFIFSRHISTGLQLDANNPLMQHLPVARKQWEILKPFHVTIKESVVAVLGKEELSAEVAIDCVMSLLLLEKSNVNAVFKTLLQLRCSAFLSCLSATGADVELRRVKDRIMASLKILNDTMELVGKCFLENGVVFQKLSEHGDSNALPTIALMDSNDTQFTYMLPDVISNYRPKFEAQTLDAAQVRATLEQWLTDIKRIAGVQLKQLFELVGSMSTIQEIKTEANCYRKHSNFTPIAEYFKLTPTLNFYESQYMPLINQRIRNIIHDSWTRAMQTTFRTLVKSLQNVPSNEQQIWTEQANELPLSLEEALNEDCKIKKLLMKTKSYDEATIALCTEFDGQLESIVSEMNVLLQEQATRAEDKLALIEFLRETAQTQLTEFLGSLKGLLLAQEQRSELLLVVRTCVALVELCPHLKICFCQQSNWRQWVGNVAGHSMEHWKRICLLLEEETFNFWQQIVAGILTANNCEQCLPPAFSYDVILEDFANWETITLEQKDEHDKIILSIIRIPNQPRISLQSYIFSLIRSLNSAIPQTLPSKVLQTFNVQLLNQLLHYYDRLAAHSTTATSQNVALQLYFDLRFLQNVFAVSRDERSLCEQFQKLQNTLKDIIDPFDFELFADHITTNIKRSVVRLNCQLGVLTPQTELVTSATTPSQEKDPNVLSLSTCGSTLWFPLLPIVTPNASGNSTSENRKAISNLETDKDTITTTPTRSSKSTTTRKTDTMKSKSGAASFFGAMSQEWFR